MSVDLELISATLERIASALEQANALHKADTVRYLANNELADAAEERQTLFQEELLSAQARYEELMRSYSKRLEVLEKALS